jgi:long-chain acyl-CoA synthetase
MDRIWYRSYDKDVPQSINYPKVPLKDKFNQNAESHPERPYLIIGDTTLTYRQSNQMARRLANALLKLGVRKGDRVALMSPNLPQYVIGLEACYKIGAIIVPTNPQATVKEITHQFKDSGSETVIAWAGIAEKPVEVMHGGSTAVKRVIVFGPGDVKALLSQSVTIGYDALLAAAAETEPDVRVDPEDVAMLQYTGGTTGVSKGCVLSNYNLLSIAYQDYHWLLPALKDVEYVKTLCCIPLYHIYGFNLNINMNKVFGGCSVLVSSPTVDNILDAINRHEPNFYSAVPAMVFGLTQHPDTPKSKIRSIKGVCCGSSPLAVEVMKRFEELSGATITEGYGLSETSNVLTVNPFGKRKPGSVGVPWPDVDIRIVDMETGTKDLPLGQAGELIAKGPAIMSGYWNNPAETAIALRDGWLYTGDIAYMDEDGFIFIVDRKKDMILCSGFNVYPREIDEILYAHPKVLQACTIGVPDPKRGETVKVFIVPKKDAVITEQEIIDYCAERLSAYKVPKYVEFLDALPLTAIGKPMRNELRKREAEKLELLQSAVAKTRQTECL